MDLSSVLGLIQTALELGLICSVTVLALYLSYSMLNVCDLSTDGCFTLGAVTGAVTAMAGHPILAIFGGNGRGAAVRADRFRFTDAHGHQQPVGRHHREYGAVFHQHCHYGRRVAAESQQNADGVLSDEIRAGRHSAGRAV